MFSWLRQRKERRERIRTEATLLIKVHGERAWQIAYARSCDFSLSDDDL
jgi:hypothetical protein